MSDPETTPALGVSEEMKFSKIYMQKIERLAEKITTDPESPLNGKWACVPAVGYFFRHNDKWERVARRIAIKASVHAVHLWCNQSNESNDDDKLTVALYATMVAFKCRRRYPTRLEDGGKINK